MAPNINHDAIAARLADIELTFGVGYDEHHACSIAALNLALTGRLTDRRHECMSPVVRSWVIVVQDEIQPFGMLRSDDEHGARWRAALPHVAGSATSGPSDAERVEMLLGWMWDALGGDTVPDWVPVSARDAWAIMLRYRTAAAATYAALAAARAAARAAAARAAATRNAANAALAAARAVANAAAVAVAAADAYAYAAAIAAAYAGDDHWWRGVDPAAMLARLVGVTL